jgi:cell division septum initiation protein DivIVA
LFALREEYSTLTEENQQLKVRIAWLEKQLFGRKSEKRVIEKPSQHDFLTPPTTTTAEPEAKSRSAMSVAPPKRVALTMPAVNTKGK